MRHQSYKYKGDSPRVLPPSDNHNFTQDEIDEIKKRNENRALNKEPKMPKGWN